MIGPGSDKNDKDGYKAITETNTSIRIMILIKNCLQNQVCGVHYFLFCAYISTPEIFVFNVHKYHHWSVMNTCNQHSQIIVYAFTVHSSHIILCPWTVCHQGPMSIHPYQAKDDSIWRWEKLFTLLRHNEYKTNRCFLVQPFANTVQPWLGFLSTINILEESLKRKRNTTMKTRKYIFLDIERKWPMRDFVNWHKWFFALMN